MVLAAVDYSGIFRIHHPAYRAQHGLGFSLRQLVTLLLILLRSGGAAGRAEEPGRIPLRLGGGIEAYLLKQGRALPSRARIVVDPFARGGKGVVPDSPSRVDVDRILRSRGQLFR